MQKLLFILLLIGIFAGGIYGFTRLNDTPKPQLHYITVGSTPVVVEYAVTTEEWKQGLGERPILKDNRGMLFLSDELRIPGFWMKGMEFPLDIIWIRNYKVIGIEHDIPVAETEEEIKTYYPPQAVDMVLEVNAGWAEKNKIGVGAEVVLD
ncbi:DUF192 domain-containing protein [candidate division WWE3 bacterium]|uniref:DUF192 domain-containing protein n=1 Tax=candidate division WWE3 bacterium TaxID=2053526 RepID=A0A955LW97_UNCKA|nr:DUF192 domain-containing protein [candidate division WWE3 bacterium]